MSRSLLKQTGVLLLVGVLPFAASLVIIDDLFSQATSVVLNTEVRAHLTRSAQAYRSFFEAERQSHQLAAQLIASDPALSQIVDLSSRDTATPVRRFLESHRDIHPRLVRLTLSSEDWESPVSVQVRPEGADRVTREQDWPIELDAMHLVLTLTFELEAWLMEELESIGDTLATFRALETLQDELASGMRKTYLVFTGGAVLLALLAGVLITRGTTRRLGDIARAAERVASGDLTTSIEIRARDELGQLARQFNEMVSQLKANQERIAYLQRITTWQEIARRLAHEIKNPLTPILLAMQQLAKKFEDDRHHPERFEPVLREVLEIVQEEVQTLETLVREFSEFARLPKADPRPVALGEFLMDFVRTNPQLRRGSELILAIDDASRAATIRIDGTMMRRALVNALDNAIEASTGGGGPGASLPRITLSARVDERGAVIEVIDGGHGIQPHDLEHLFEPYFTTKEHGTGLGLAIVKRIVLDHEGTVELANRTDAPGCRLTLTLPLNRADAEPPPEPIAEGAGRAR